MYDHPKLSSSFFRRVQGKVVRSSQVVSVFVMVKMGPKGAFFDPKGYQKNSDFLRWMMGGTCNFLSKSFYRFPVSELLNHFL